jgi:hypothetical protein
MWFNVLMTFDRGTGFWTEMEHAANNYLAFLVYFFFFFVLVAILLLNMLVCIFIEAYVKFIDESRAAKPVYIELCSVLYHDLRALSLPKSKVCARAHICAYLNTH